jgi:hypothetical protein
LKKASRFEIVAARCWNVLNEGKTFTPVFVAGVWLLYFIPEWHHVLFWSSTLWAVIGCLPLFIAVYLYDYPLFLRNFLWLPVVLALLFAGRAPWGLYLLAAGLYFFFTVFFWGTFYYHLRIGTPWNNYRRFWKLVLKNSDSTSGNAQEQLPKLLLLLTMIYAVYSAGSGLNGLGLGGYAFCFLFCIAYWGYSWALHHFLFDWKPAEITANTLPKALGSVTQKVIMIVIDGCRKDRLEEASTPFLDWVRENGTSFERMETVYPARTVVCFSSMFTGALPHVHGIKSNMVWRLGVRAESIFQAMRKQGKLGRLLGIAHLIDAFGDDVESVTAVMKNDLADAYIMERARHIMLEQNPDLLVVQLIATDQTGHSRGALYQEYREKIEEADAHIARFYQWLEENGHLRDTTLIICADHGQSDGIGGHGHLDEGERFVPFMMLGPQIARNARVDRHYSLTSVANTIAYLLGVSYPEHSGAPVLQVALAPDKQDQPVYRRHPSAIREEIGTTSGHRNREVSS